MKIQFHGAAQTVTGSMHLVTANGKRLLLDCGLYQGPRRETYARNRSFAFDPRSIDAVILTHAHVDHCGNLPHLVKNGFSGPIYCTPATAHLADLMMRDSGAIQESDAAFVNKHRARRGEPPIEPLYTQEDAGQVRQYFKQVDYAQSFSPFDGVSTHLWDAGHILGSASIDLHIEERHKTARLWFSGDIGRRSLPLLRDPVLPRAADYLIMECTYGDKPHRDPEAAFIEFRDVVRLTLSRGGKVIIPAFAIGRTQELVYHLNRMMSDGDVPRAPVFVDSPLAVNASEIFLKFPECYDQETQDFIRAEKHPALKFDRLTYVRSAEESKALNSRREPMVIISASGMAETGRILHHLKNNIEDPRNTVCIVSWQAPNTLGRRLADRQEYIKIFGETYQRRAQVATIGGLSAHAGQDLLVEYATGVQHQVKEIFLVHGEPRPALALKEKLAARQMERVHYPDLYQSVEFEL